MNGLKEVLSNKILVAIIVLFLSFTGIREFYVNAVLIPFMSTTYEDSNYSLIKNGTDVYASGQYEFNDKTYTYTVKVAKNYKGTLTLFVFRNKYFLYKGTSVIIVSIIKFIILIALYKMLDSDNSITFVIQVYAITGVILAFLTVLV